MTGRSRISHTVYHFLLVYMTHYMDWTVWFIARQISRMSEQTPDSDPMLIQALVFAVVYMT